MRNRANRAKLRSVFTFSDPQAMRKSYFNELPFVRIGKCLIQRLIGQLRRAANVAAGTAAQTKSRFRATGQPAARSAFAGAAAGII